MHARTAAGAFALLVTALAAASPLDPHIAMQDHSDLAEVKVSSGVRPEDGAAAKSKPDKHDCPSCGLGFLHHMEEKQEEALLVEAVKRHVLNKLGLRERPANIRPIPRPAILAAVNQLYDVKRVRRGHGDPKETPGGHDVSEIVSFASFDGWRTNSLQLRLEFPTEQHLRVAWLHSADLWLHLHRAEGVPWRPDGSASALLRVVAHAAGGASHVEVQRRVEVAAEAAWVSVSLLAAVRAALERKDTGLGVSVECTGCVTLSGRVSKYRAEVDTDATTGTPGDGGSTKDAEPMDFGPHGWPFLLLRMGSTQGGSRTRRRSDECDGVNSLCCLQRFYVDFQKINWSDWIIQPAGFQSNYCQGECRVTQVLNGTTASSLRSIIINQYHLRGLGPVASKSICCVPIRFSSVSILYYNDKNNIVKKDVPDMMAEECGCI